MANIETFMLPVNQKEKGPIIGLQPLDNPDTLGAKIDRAVVQPQVPFLRVGQDHVWAWGRCTYGRHHGRRQT